MIDGIRSTCFLYYLIDECYLFIVVDFYELISSWVNYLDAATENNAPPELIVVSPHFLFH